MAKYEPAHNIYCKIAGARSLIRESSQGTLKTANDSKSLQADSEDWSARVDAQAVLKVSDFKGNAVPLLIGAYTFMNFMCKSINLRNTKLYKHPNN